MRVFAVTPRYPPASRVGAWLATHEFLASLAERGHDVDVMPWQGMPTQYELDGVRVVPLDKELVARIRASDVVVSHLGDNGLAHRHALKNEVPSVRLVHSPRAHAHRLLMGAALVVVNSEATKKALELPSALVCPPPTWPEKHRVVPGGAVTLVNLSRRKGALTFWSVARQMPDVKFLGVRGGYGGQETKDLPNVEILPTQQDMREVWSRTRVLLMPSDREAWGMTAVEAMCSGIPVIAHPSAGLRESAGNGAIWIDRGAIAIWIRMIRLLIERPSAWVVASKQAELRAREIDPQASVDRFCTAVEKLAA